MKKTFKLLIVFVILTTMALGAENTTSTGIKNKTNFDFKKDGVQQYKVTFIELGSVNCVPCKMMQPVMKKVEEKYPKDVKVVFYDVWTKEGEPYGKQYGIKAIPTQVFLDKDGKEYYRHTGFFDYDSLEKILKMKGVGSK